MRFQAAEGTGAAIRKLRLAKGWTLAELSKQTGVPLATLSRVELGQNALNYDKLVRLCRALDVDLQGFVTREAQGISVSTGRRSVTSAGQGAPVVVNGATGLVAAADLLEKHFTPVVLTAKAATLADHGPMSVLAGEAYLMVLVGTVVLQSQIYAPLTLGEGDGVYFDGRSPHAILAAGPNEAKVLLVVASDQTFAA
jgi:transcriptional regulator with XRE-family HTH domain